jgi:alpha-L-arabinofuranosidase
MMHRVGSLFCALVLALVAPSALAVSGTIDVDVNKPGPQMPPTFYGLMTEEINHSYDGGLFAELIQNRSFQDPRPRGAADSDLPIHWFLVQEGNGAKVVLDKDNPVTPALPISLRLELNGSKAGVANDGFWGIAIRPDTKYTASFYARAGGNFSGPVTASLVTDDGNATVAQAATSTIDKNWKKYDVTLTTGHDAPTTSKAKFLLSATGNGSVTFSLVSLFPPTYENVPNGLRPDLMKLMADMHPSFVRLPGGNYVEGDTFETRFNWKQMIGRPEDRPGHMGCWSYRSSDGFGLPQYLLWCKQLGAEPVLALFAGYVLRHQHVDAGSPEMKQYTQEALEEIEYVTGSSDSEWGKKRAEDGFAEPFKLHYVEIGNEDWFDRSGSYEGRFTEMFDAIRAKYPDLKIIATAPIKGRKPDLYDDHYYRSALQMSTDWTHYDPGHTGPVTFNGGHHDGEFDRANGPRIFVGEWATREGQPTPNLTAALADATWLMGMERNGDLVSMECYAPLFVNVSPEDRENGYPRAWQWGTDLIGYDALTAYGSPSYYVQMMYGQNKADHVLPTQTNIEKPKEVAAAPAPHGAIGLGSWHTQVEYKDIVVTSPDGQELLKPDLSGDAGAWKTVGARWQIADGVLKPSADSETWAITGKPEWTDYTIKLKARKTVGPEGFLILWHATDTDNYRWWNIGGWGNTKTQCEVGVDNNRSQYGPSSRFTVNADQWYDLKLEVTGDRVRGYVDGKLVTDATAPKEITGPAVYAQGSYVDASHELILKVVNISKDPLDATINLKGAGEIGSSGKAWVLTGNAKDVNSIEEPTKIAPKEEDVTGASTSFKRTFAPYSLTLIRMPAKP